SADYSNHVLDLYDATGAFLITIANPVVDLSGFTWNYSVADGSLAALSAGGELTLYFDVYESLGGIGP
ncbi:MAG TPA: hypothetical protein VIG24_12225, partial [Acidimicrobiia bacterium]